MIDVTPRSYATAIREALRAEWKGSGSMQREIGIASGASNGTVKKWLQGWSGPSGWHLVKLIAASDEVLDAVMTLAGRQTEGVEARDRMRQAIAALRGTDEPSRPAAGIPSKGTDHAR